MKVAILTDTSACLIVDKIKELLDAYQTEIKPWYDKTLLELRGISTDDGGTTETETDN